MNCSINICDTLDENEVALIHGTSLEAALSYLQKGVFTLEPFSRKPETNNHLYFYPNPRQIQPELVNEDNCDWDTNQLMTHGYSNFLSREHFFTAKLGHYTPAVFHAVASCEQTGQPKKEYEEAAKKYRKELCRVFREAGHSQQLFAAYWKSAWKRRGVVLGFNREILSLPIHQDDGADGAVYISVPQGLGIEYLHSIQPLGDVERALLKSK
jgi:hypothetical protein